jgi:hypothetical protein
MNHVVVMPISSNSILAGARWQITFDVTLAGGEQDSPMFGFCVE